MLVIAIFAFTWILTSAVIIAADSGSAPLGMTKRDVLQCIFAGFVITSLVAIAGHVSGLTR